ncbi:unnamed protein product, partial [Brachionus calyciflorus]
MPTSLNIGIVKLLVKDTSKNTSDINNMRPLTISDVWSIILEKILLREIIDSYETRSNQFGFRAGSSCGHSVFTLKELVLFNKRKKRRTYVCSIDASKAFDKINRTMLWSKLIDEVFIGGPLSPILFSIYIDKLGQMLNKLATGIKIDTITINNIFYADDVLLIANSLDKMNQLLEITNKYGQEYEIKFNPNKTHFMIMFSKQFKENRENGK